MHVICDEHRKNPDGSKGNNKGEKIWKTKMEAGEKIVKI